MCVLNYILDKILPPIITGLIVWLVARCILEREKRSRENQKIIDDLLISSYEFTDKEVRIITPVLPGIFCIGLKYGNRLSPIFINESSKSLRADIINLLKPQNQNLCLQAFKNPYTTKGKILHFSFIINYDQNDRTKKLNEFKKILKPLCNQEQTVYTIVLPSRSKSNTQPQ